MAPSPRRALAGALLALALAGCSRSAPQTAIATGSPSAAPTTTSAGTPADDASVVAGLSPADLRDAVEQPAPASSRARRGPVAERVVLAGGRSVWRVRIPGSFPVRSARVQVLVGGRAVGAGMVTSELDGLVAVTVDPAGLVRGAAVSYRWEGRPAVAAGTLEVAP